MVELIDDDLTQGGFPKPRAIRGLTLTQPWATLVALGEKHYETRSWDTGYRGLVAIHAAKKFPARRSTSVAS